jgi:hypothetical protein
VQTCPKGSRHSSLPSGKVSPMFNSLLHSFTDEMTKIAYATVRPQDKADDHFVQEVKDWGAFEKNLKAKGFQKAILAHPEADAKLKRYVKNYGAYLSSKDIVGRVSSRSRFRNYVIKKLPNGRLGCNCKDWQYAHSTRNTDCFHIRDLKAHGMEKTSASIPFAIARGLGATHRIKKSKGEALKGRIAEENRRRIHLGQPLIGVR